MWYAAAAGVWVTSERVDRTLFSDCPGGLSPLLIAAACRVGARIAIVNEKRQKKKKKKKRDREGPRQTPSTV